MKVLINCCLAAVLIALCSGVFVPPRPGHHKQKLLGQKECTWGPSYWCTNLTSAAGCKAVNHCIQTVWIHKQLPPDTSSICQTCLDMVKQARDQLVSNDTQELIKEVFEGSCHLLRLKPVVAECDKLADQFIPELVDTLASEMNPQVVCSVAGLCNNARWQNLLEAEEQKASLAPNNCDGCHMVVNLMETKLKAASPNDLLNGLLTACGKLGSFSDSCSNLVVTYFTEIQGFLIKNFNSEEVCLMAGECSAQFHTHVEITPKSHIGYVPVKDDPLPCELCEQLVKHLRDLLIANTTESEFKLVLQGLCKQTGNFKDECLGLVDAYYGMAYQFLLEELNSTVVCGMIGICPAGFKDGHLAPLLNQEAALKMKNLMTTKKPTLHRVALQKQSLQVMNPQNAQLPIELLMPPHSRNLYNMEACVFCEYFLHYVQQEMTNPTTEDQLKSIIDKACDKLPSSINQRCIGFVESYEPAMIAILAEEIDPSQICPLLHICPATDQRDVEIFMKQESSSKCPLCLYAVTELESMIKDKKTEANIRDALTKLCNKLSTNLAGECNDFVQTYANELVEMMVADFKPTEVCAFLKLCSDTKAEVTTPEVVPLIGGDVQTNVIPDDTVDGRKIAMPQANPQCVICEFVMKEIEDQLKNKKTDDEIKKIVHGVCKIMPKSVAKECNDFVEQYADTVIQLLIASVDPQVVCSYIQMCDGSTVENVKGEILNCAICDAAVDAMEKVLSNPNVDHNIEHVLAKSCRALPIIYRSKCQSFVAAYGKEVVVLVQKHVNRHEICSKVNNCVQEMVGTNSCTYGPSYWCASHKNAQECGATSHCVDKVWHVESPITRRSVKLLGEEKCTWGPSYWCASEENANSCGHGAKTHCEEKVWKTKTKREVVAPGSQKCTWGPGYWCASKENAEECGLGAIQHCKEKVWSTRNKRDVIVGANKCTWGPSYWCASEKNADECGTREHCEKKVWKTKTRREVPVLGAQKCTWGPGYWCASQENADECGEGARAHCEKKVWKTKTKRETLIFGAQKCTWGPSYWCASEKNADECGEGARAHCEKKVWKTKTKREVPVLGAQKCTWGPGYWCASQENADECGEGARAHCEEKVWKNKTKRNVGEKECTYGPSFWCASKENAEKCGEGAKKHCEDKVWKQ